jgi:SpoVK/Ycf46/Vps4 family AAA+-type ATPase
VLPLEKVQALQRFFREWRAREVLVKHGVPVRNSILLHGPSGNGKTAIAESLATEMQLKFSVVQTGSIIESWLGSTLRNLQQLFDFAHSTPAVVLFDECDSLLTARDRMGGSSAGQEMQRAVNVILAALDGAPIDSVFAFATNFAETLDPAFLRRMTTALHLDAPSIEGKRELIARLRRRWSFIRDGAWIQTALEMPSFAECEQVVAEAARAQLVDGV